MGDIDNSLIDREDWTEESVAAAVRASVERCGKHYFIPASPKAAPAASSRRL